jgi:hypothetical protein
MRRLIGVALMVLLWMAIPAQAATIVLPNGTERAQPYQRWVDASAVPLPVERITVVETACPADLLLVSACVFPDEPTTIYFPREFDRWTFLHEIGHIVDLHMPERTRNGFRKILGDNRGWGDPDGPLDSPLEEQWAWAWAWCARRTDRVPMYAPGYSGYEGARKHRRVCALMVRLVPT